MSDPELLRDVLANDPLLLTPEEAATVLGIGRTTIYALMKADELHPVHIGRSCRLPRAELERFVDRLQAPAIPAPPRRSAPPADHHEPGRTLRLRPQPAGCALICGSTAARVGPTPDTRRLVTAETNRQ